MKTPFDIWLRELGAAGKLVKRGIRIDRGVPFAWSFALAGDWTSATIKSALRLNPDAGEPIEEFSCSNDGMIDEATVFTIALTADETGALPFDGTGEAVTRMAWDILFTPPGGDELRLLGGAASVVGEVTQS